MKRGWLVGVVGVAFLGVVGSAGAATPSPDPPPLAVAPEIPKAAPDPTTPTRQARQAPAVTRSVVVETPVVTPTVSTPVIVIQEAPARPAPKKEAAKQTAQAARLPRREPVVTTPPERTHDRPLLARPVAVVAVVDELDRGAFALAGAGLAIVAFGGAVLLLATRRQLEELAR